MTTFVRATAGAAVVKAAEKGETVATAVEAVAETEAL